MGETYITCQDDQGSINISEDVISSMVRAAVMEVDGVAGLSNTAGAEIAELIGIKTVAKGVKVQFVEDKIVVDTIITVQYGSKIVEVARNVQEKVLNVIQATTGFEQAEVNVHVSGIAFDK